MQLLPISKLALAAGVNVETIRFYQRRGLLAEPDKPPRGIRRYDRADVARVQFIKAAQRIGFTLDEVAQLLQLDDGTRCSEARTSPSASSPMSAGGWATCSVSSPNWHSSSTAAPRGGAS